MTYAARKLRSIDQRVCLQAGCGKAHLPDSMFCEPHERGQAWRRNRGMRRLRRYRAAQLPLFTLPR